MKIKIPDPKPDKTLDWHEWYAWRPVIAKEAGYYTVNTYVGSEYVVWRRYVLRKKLIIDCTANWIYEVR